MKQTKRIVALLIAVTLLAMTPLSALAAYVPTKAEHQYYDGTKWVTSSTATYSFSKDGKLKKSTWKSSYGSSWEKYSWKGNYITSITESGGGKRTIKYSGKKRKSWTYTDSDNKETMKYTWKKNKAIFKGDGYTTTYSMNGKGQITKQETKYSGGSKYTFSYTYYSNGNMKKRTYKSGSYSWTENYNKNGFLTSFVSKGGEYPSKETYKYKKNKKGQITQVTITGKSSEGTWKNRTIYSKQKKVSRTRNCDGSGWMVYLP